MLFFIFLFIIPLSLSIEIKACVNCKHVILEIKDIYYSKCFLFPKVTKENEFEKNKKMLELAVTGIGELTVEPQTFFYCSTAREYDDMCGLTGSKFEKK